MEIANSRVQTDTEIIMDAQTEVKLFVQKAVVNLFVVIDFDKKVMNLIKKGLEEVKNEDLKLTATKTLFYYAKQEFQRQVQLLGVGMMPVVVSLMNRQSAVNMLTDNKQESLKKSVSQVQRAVNETLKQLPMADLNKAFTNLGDSQAKVSYSQSLYGHSELNARFEEQQKMVRDLKAKTNLVICDTHSDCSDRCSMWQGKIYSLDGTSGKTEDGKDYIPLETATNAMFKGHRNGLLGYNCRHKLYAYTKGMRAVRVNERERKKEYALTKQQRKFEREIRSVKDKALTFKTGASLNQFDKKHRYYMEFKYKEYLQKAEYLTKQYNEFCNTNNRIAYKSRLEI